MGNEEHIYLLERLSAVLIRCFFFSLAVLFLWFIFFLIGGDAGYRLHSQLFGLSRHDYDVLNYFGIAFTKICAFLFFLFPYISIRLVLRKRKV
ncbi:MAG TPA: hypothetical protein PLX02_15080 [Syntrophorhabdaceae bacterium]|nr:hypothetical protein [Syntrophorhabdaceae bacterium]HQM82929.1 hypothetical protein [Syntrophorhabdaceae bacterium]